MSGRLSNWAMFQIVFDGFRSLKVRCKAGFGGILRIYRDVYCTFLRTPLFGESCATLRRSSFVDLGGSARRFLGGSIVLASMLVLASSLPAEEESISNFDERLAIVRFVVDQIQSEIGKMHSWSGRYTVTDESLISESHEAYFRQAKIDTFVPPILQITKSDMRFAVDFRGDRLFTTLEAQAPPTLLEKASGRVLKAPLGTFRQRSILTPEHFLYMDPEQLLGQINNMPPVKQLSALGGRVAFRKESSKGKNLQLSTVVDPRLLFSVDGEPSDEVLGVWANWLLEHPDDRQQLEKMIDVKRSGDNSKPTFVITITRGPIDNPLIASYTCKWEDGFNISRFREEAAAPLRKCDIEYVRQDGIIVPKQHVLTLYDSDGTTVRHQRAMTLIDSEVNEDVGTESFGYRALGLRQGERVVDEIDGAVYLFDGKELVLPEDFYPARTPNRAYWRWIITANFLVLMGFAVVAGKKLRERVAGG